MSMYSETSNRQTAEQLEKLLYQTLNEEDRQTRNKIQSYLLPLFKEAVRDSGGCYSSSDAARVIGSINDDNESWS